MARDLSRSKVAAIAYPLLALQLLFQVGLEVRASPAPPNTLRGWAGLAGCLAWGASALFLLRSLAVGWPSWTILAASYGAGIVVTALLLMVISAIGR